MGLLPPRDNEATKHDSDPELQHPFLRVRLLIREVRIGGGGG
jgi:hypothetical protein